MVNCKCLDEKYSTTRLIISKRPKIVNKPEDNFETILFLPKTENRKGEGGLRTKEYYKFSYENLIINDEYLILNDKNGNKYQANNSKFNIQNLQLNKLPLISIVTVVYNGGKYLENTIQSVINQTYPNVEYIIIDGGSKDESVDIIRKYEDKIDYWVSEKDTGIYDAMNKGISLCNGEIIGIINSDDYFNSKDVFTSIVNSYHLHNFDIYSAGANKIDYDSGTIIKTIMPNLNLLIFSMTLAHPGTFIKKSIYKHFGLYDTSYLIAADYDLLLKNKIQKSNFFLDFEAIANMRTGGISDTNILQSKKERYLIRKKNLNKLQFLFTQIIIEIRAVLKKIMHVHNV